MIFWRRNEPDLQAGQQLVAKLIMQKDVQEKYSQTTGSIPVRTDIDMSGPAWTDGQRGAAAALVEAFKSKRVLLSLAHNMAQPNQHLGGDDRRHHRVHPQRQGHARAGGGPAARRRGKRARMTAGGGAGARSRAGGRGRRPAPDGGSIGMRCRSLVIWVPLLINAAHVVGFTLWTTWLSFTPSDLLPEYTWAGLRSYWAVTRAPSTQIAYLNLVIYSVAFVGAGHAARLRAGGAARPAHPRRERAAHDLSLSARGVVRRHRHGVELAAQSRPRHPEVRAQSRLGELPLRLDHRPRHGALHHRDRGRLARRGLRDGAVPRRAALDRSRPAQGGADRRRRPDALLSARRAAEHRRRS